MNSELAALAHALIDERAEREHPHDIYAQTCVVMGYDPLATHDDDHDANAPLIEHDAATG